jgi:hypothetical protein
VTRAVPLVTKHSKGKRNMSITSRKIKAKVKMIELGIIPAFTGYELTQMLSSLSEDERRIAKRKFRKQWKKLLRGNPDLYDIIIPESGAPEKQHLRNRACMVISSIIRESAL